jgi:hypothetical protein
MAKGYRYFSESPKTGVIMNPSVDAKLYLKDTVTMDRAVLILKLENEEASRLS